MRWQGGRQGGNIEDRRGLGPIAAGGGIGGVALAVIAYLLFGEEGARTVMNMQGQGMGAEQQQGVQGSPSDEQGKFADVVTTSVNDVWAQEFQRSGQRYEPPVTVLYTQATTTACGVGQAGMGPFYCPNDRKVYLDLSFFQELSDRFGAPGEFARAYVIAHEIGHHVQTLTGTSAKVHQAQQAAGDQAEANQWSVRLELQADCYAGVWANRYGSTRRLESGDIESALGAASAVGDDVLQRRGRGTVSPDSFTHGSAAQRTRWFRVGYDSGDPGACDTFR
jgi:predicted metalloprotease